MAKGLAWRYAPVWAIGMGATASLLKSVSQRALLDEKWEVRWSDVGTALAGAALAYVAFRVKYGQKHDNPLKR